MRRASAPWLYCTRSLAEHTTIFVRTEKSVVQVIAIRLASDTHDVSTTSITLTQANPGFSDYFRHLEPSGPRFTNTKGDWFCWADLRSTVDCAKLGLNWIRRWVST